MFKILQPVILRCNAQIARYVRVVSVTRHAVDRQIPVGTG